MEIRKSLPEKYRNIRSYGYYVFLMIKKNNAKFRANLELSKLLDSIMVIKMNSPEESILCHKLEFLNKLLESCISTFYVPNLQENTRDEV